MTGLAEFLARSGEMEWDLMGFGGIGRHCSEWGQPSRLRGRLSARVLKGGMSRDSRAESPAIQDARAKV